MAEIVFSSTNDSTVFNRHNGTDVSNVIGDASTSGTGFNNTSTTQTNGVLNRTFAVRGSSDSSFRCNRSFFEYDLSGFTGTATDADFYFFTDNLGGSAGTENTIFVVEATPLAGSTADFGNVFSSGTTVGTSFGSVQVSTTNQYHVVNGNSDLLTAINNKVGSGTLTVGVMGKYDYTIATGTSAAASWPSIGATDHHRVQLIFADNSGTGKDPYLEITGISVATGGYGHNVSGVAAANIGNINGVATANIGKVNNVD